MTAAFVLVQVDSAGGGTSVRSVHDALHAISGVKTVHFLAGPTDAIIFLEVTDQMELMKTVGEIRATGGVASTDTRIVLPF